MDVYLGVVLEINGKEIALEPKTAINKIKEQGIEAELPAGTEVRLGSIAGGLQGFVQKFQPGFTFPAKTDLPTPLQGVYGALTTVELTINDLYIKVPPKEPAGGKNSYRLGIYVGWPTPQELVGNLSLKGFSVKIQQIEPAPQPS